MLVRGVADGGIGIVEMLFCTSLVALVGAGEQPAFSPRRIQLVNTKRQSTICELNFVTSILSVKLNRKRLAVALEEHIHVYDVSNMKILHTIDTAPNPQAICALAPSGDNCYIAYPANNTTGEVLIFDALSLQTVNIIQAHKSPIAYMTFNYDGTLLATASDKGTVIRVFSVPSGQRIYQFRRGTIPAKIYSINFNMQSNMLVVTSATDTVHIFRLARAAGLRGTLLGSASYLPEIVSEMWEPVRDFAHLKLPTTGLITAAALSHSSPQVMVLTSDGYFLVYNIDLENGGECVLLKQHSLLDSTGSSAGNSRSNSIDRSRQSSVVAQQDASTVQSAARK